MEMLALSFFHSLRRLRFNYQQNVKWNFRKRPLSPAAAWYFTLIVYSFPPGRAEKDTQRQGSCERFTSGEG
jgi:hypothetical protein